MAFQKDFEIMFIVRKYPSNIVILAFLLTLFKPEDASASQPPISLTVCHEYSCNAATEVMLSERNWRKIIAPLLTTSMSPQIERKKIAMVIATIESYVGPLTGTANDQPGNEADTPDGQMDCIDESNNTTSYLTVLQNSGLLRWHRVSERAYRAPWIFDQHWTATMTDISTNQQYAIDSWHLANGQQPYIQTIEDWRKKAPLPVLENTGSTTSANKVPYLLGHQTSPVI